jgi:hypothetical protein
VEGHEGCKFETDQDDETPARILDVRSPDCAWGIRLVAGDTPRLAAARYIALSHCWGMSGPPIRTTRESLQDYEREVELSALPKSFQDAVTVTRSLGVRYLWIDSLCIVQNDEKDWEAEASKMSSVYSHAYITLAATEAKNSTEGFGIGPQDASIVVDLSQSSGNHETGYQQGPPARTLRKGVLRRK